MSDKKPTMRKEDGDGSHVGGDFGLVRFQDEIGRQVLVNAPPGRSRSGRCNTDRLSFLRWCEASAHQGECEPRAPEWFTMAPSSLPMPTV